MYDKDAEMIAYFNDRQNGIVKIQFPNANQSPEYINIISKFDEKSTRGKYNAYTPDEITYKEFVEKVKEFVLSKL